MQDDAEWNDILGKLKVQGPDLDLALTPLVDAFEQLGITYYIGGSVSSSLHGLARRTQDVDVIADIGPGRVHSLVQALQNDYYVDEQAWKDAASCVTG